MLRACELADLIVAEQIRADHAEALLGEEGEDMAVAVLGFGLSLHIRDAVGSLGTADETVEEDDRQLARFGFGGQVGVLEAALDRAGALLDGRHG
jgi:hypothetical protein